MPKNLPKAYNSRISSVCLLHLGGNATDAVENVGFHNKVR